MRNNKPKNIEHCRMQFEIHKAWAAHHSALAIVYATQADEYRLDRAIETSQRHLHLMSECQSAQYKMLESIEGEDNV